MAPETETGIPLEESTCLGRFEFELADAVQRSQFLGESHNAYDCQYQRQEIGQRGAEFRRPQCKDESTQH